jgi:hypothetical protein
MSLLDQLEIQMLDLMTKVIFSAYKDILGLGKIAHACNPS